MFLHRLITAVLLIPIVIAIILYAPSYWFDLLLASLLALGIWEWTALIDLKKTWRRISYLLFLLIVMLLFLSVPLVHLLWIGFVWWLIPIYFIFEYDQWPKFWGHRRWIRELTGLFVFIPCWIGLRFLHQRPSLILFVLILIWSVDSGAYFAGKQFGRHKLAPNISPNKTWEGLAGGFIAAIIVTLLSIPILKFPLATSCYFLLLALLTTLLSMVGDLFESMVKRFIGRKDSGRLLPGHGGLLDRIDSLLAAVPIFALGVYLLGLTK